MKILKTGMLGCQNDLKKNLPTLDTGTSEIASDDTETIQMTATSLRMKKDKAFTLQNVPLPLYPFLTKNISSRS